MELSTACIARELATCLTKEQVAAVARVAREEVLFTLEQTLEGTGVGVAKVVAGCEELEEVQGHHAPHLWILGHVTTDHACTLAEVAEAQALAQDCMATMEKEFISNTSNLTMFVEADMKDQICERFEATYGQCLALTYPACFSLREAAFLAEEVREVFRVGALAIKEVTKRSGAFAFQLEACLKEPGHLAPSSRPETGPGGALERRAGGRAGARREAGKIMVVLAAGLTLVSALHSWW